MRFFGSCVFLSKGFRKIRVNQNTLAFPLQKKAALSKPPQVKMLFFAGEVNDFLHQLIIFFNRFYQLIIFHWYDVPVLMPLLCQPSVWSFYDPVPGSQENQ